MKLFFIILLFCSDVFGVKNGRKRPRAPGVEAAVAETDPAARTREQWAMLSTESLRLQCAQDFLMQTGLRATLIDRLLQFYAGEQPTGNVVREQEEVADVLNAPVVADQRAEVVTLNTQVASSSSSNLNISTIVDQVVARIMSGQQMPVASGTTQTVTTSIPYGGARPRVPRQTQAIDQDEEQRRFSGEFQSPLSDFNPLGQSGRYSSQLPAIPKAVLEKIKNGEFVNFDNLLPNSSPVLADEYTFKLVGGSSPSVAQCPSTRISLKLAILIHGWSPGPVFSGRIQITGHIVFLNSPSRMTRQKICDFCWGIHQTYGAPVLCVAKFFGAEHAH